MYERAGCIPLRRQQWSVAPFLFRTVFENARMPDCPASSQSGSGIK